MESITKVTETSTGFKHPSFSFELDSFQTHAYNILERHSPKKTETVEAKAVGGAGVSPEEYSNSSSSTSSLKIVDIKEACNILCCAHTGSGKSVLIELGLLKAIELGMRYIITSPIKALANQQFYNLSRKYSHISFGIITGDHKHNPLAQVLIMTTEILMMMLSNAEIKIGEMSFSVDIKKEVYGIAFDEMHYINDAERGSVWEKCIMTIPENVSIIMLSATIDKPENFLTWVQNVTKNPSYLLINEKRVVPLHFSYGIFYSKTTLPKELKKYEGNLNTLNNIMDTDTRTLSEEALNKYLFFSKYFRDNKVNFRWIISQTCKYLATHDMCPAIFFVFSKKTCFFLAEAISESYNSSAEAHQVEHDIDYYLSKLEHKDAYKQTPQYFQMVALAKKGIAVHHAGLIPVFKEIIELLFAKRLIKILFATETFAVGLNMPIKTVIFTDIFKFDNNGKRMLYSHEFIQMSGRAGRRGLDKIGHVILLPQTFTETIDSITFKSLMLGKPQAIRSKFYIDESLILDFVRKNSIDLSKIEDFVKKTLMNSEVEKEKIYLDNKLSELDKKVKAYVFKNYELFEEKNTIIKELNASIQPSKSQRKNLSGRLKAIEDSGDYKSELAHYTSFLEVSKQFKDSASERDNLDVFIANDIKYKFKFLSKYKYFNEEGVLTTKGNIALLFRDMDSVIGAEIVFSDFVDMLNEDKYITLLTLITEGKSKENEIPEDHIEVLSFVDEMFPTIRPNCEYVYPVLDWYYDKHIAEIITEYGIFEGDLIKYINKMIRYIDEINEGYIMKNNLKMVEMLNKIKGKLQRDIISNESLYLRL